MKKTKQEEPAFKVAKRNVSWKFKRGTIKMTLNNLDKIFYQYSKHGLNMTQVQVQNDHGLTALEWQSFKRTFDLVKDSDVFSPYSLSLVTKKKACDMIAEKMAEKYSPKNMRDVITYEDGKQTHKAYQKAIKDNANTEFRWRQFQNGLLEYITRAEEAPLVKKSKDIQDGVAIVHVCDLHYGADIKKERNLPAYNAKVIETKLKTVANDVNSRKPKKVKLIINGDLIESFTGLSHINSWKNIDKKNGYGVEATIAVTELLTKFVSSINNVDEVVLVSGNHDRVTSNNKEDVAGEVVRWVQFILNERFKKFFKISWSRDVAPMKVERCGFVFTHGHLAISKKNADHIVNQYGFANSFNLVIMAHLHTRKVLSDNWNNRTIHAPSIFTGNDYSKGLGFSSLSGYMYITVKGGLPVVVDVPIA